MQLAMHTNIPHTCLSSTQFKSSNFHQKSKDFGSNKPFFCFISAAKQIQEKWQQRRRLFKFWWAISLVSYGVLCCNFEVQLRLIVQFSFIADYFQMYSNWSKSHSDTFYRWSCHRTRDVLMFMHNLKHRLSIVHPDKRGDLKKQ